MNGRNFLGKRTFPKLTVRGFKSFTPLSEKYLCKVHLGNSKIENSFLLGKDIKLAKRR